jgi:hypothetical protein
MSEAKGRVYMQGEEIRVLKSDPGLCLVDAIYEAPDAARLGCHRVTVNGISGMLVETSQIYPATREIRLESGALLFTNERGKLAVHGPYEPAEERTFREMLHGKLGLTILARRDLAAEPIIMREGQGLS